MYANMRQTPVSNAKTLNSWKEVASYLGRGVRTVQRWEAELQLPVHRMGTSERSPVFAFRAELDNWLRKQAGPLNLDIAPNLTKSDRVGNSLNALDRSARLTSKTMQLIEKQQAQTRQITEQLQRMSNLLPMISKIGLPPSDTYGRNEDETSARSGPGRAPRKRYRISSAANS